MITTDISGTGYVPGNTYIITTFHTGISLFGFQTAAQNASGTDLGTFSNISTDTQLKTKTISTVVVHSYITHTSTGSPGAGGKAFVYNWTAPITGSSPVTFYGTFMDADDAGSTSGDIVYSSTTTVQENTSVGVEQVASKTTVNVYPTVSKGNFTVEVNEGAYSLEIYSLTGEKVFEKTTNATVEHISLNVTSGLYFVNIKKDNKNTIKKIVIQ